MKKIYNPKDIERPLYEFWEKNGFFKPNNDITKESFCIMIPPPNITGTLHMGHAFQQTIMDILIRYHRMQGKNTLWQVGTDHAGIATQMLVEQKIFLEEGKKRHDYKRSEFIKKIWEWKNESNSFITHQMRRLGNSVDWDRERFTLDSGISDAVKEVFLLLYDKNLIYRRKKIVNWDPKLKTVISDLEVEHNKVQGFMWYIRYPLVENYTKDLNSKKYLVVATTRPETLLGDVALAVHPNDFRYSEFVGKYVFIPIINRKIPVICDEFVDMKKGTGCVKITPAHDMNDYKIASRHKLSMINIFTRDAKIRETFKKYDYKGVAFTSSNNLFSPVQLTNIDRFLARKKIIDLIKKLGLLENIQTCDLVVPYGDRSGAVIEPMLTNQWYLRINSLSHIATKAVKNKEIIFIPKQYENVFFSWMKNIEDWCISRQLWWGHQIPIWYDMERNMYAGRNEKEVRKKYNISNNINLIQEEDVLDTWFSSSLWTFSSLGWPNSTNFLKIFHSTNVLVSGFDIIFFWIARMIMLTMYVIKDKNGKPQVPFKTVYITGLIRDEFGKKMSKSKGNVIDPLDMIDGISLKDLLKKRTENMIKPKLAKQISESTKKKFPNGIPATGTDALRLTFSFLGSTTRHISWDASRLNSCRNFCNKFWNASRFILTNFENQRINLKSNCSKVLSLTDKWILVMLNNMIKNYRKALDNYRFDIASSILYDFVWNEFCDWYLEFSKPIIIIGSISEKKGTLYTLINTLDSLLRLAHPIIPFITESIWQRIKLFINDKAKTIMLQPFPIYNKELDKNSNNILLLQNVIWIKKIIIAIRDIRNCYNIKSNISLSLFLDNITPKISNIINLYGVYLKKIVNLKDIKILKKDEIKFQTIIRTIDEVQLLIPVDGILNRKTELNRLTKELHQIENKINIIKSKLINKNFIQYAPFNVVIKEKNALIKLKNVKKKLLDQKKYF